MSELIGEKHQKLLAWLRNTWLPGDKPVCFLQGFSGAGKKAVALELIKNLPDAYRPVSNLPVELSETGGDLLDELLSHLATAFSNINVPDLAQASDTGQSLGEALKRVIAQQPVLLVIRGFHHALDNTGKPLNTFQVFNEIAASVRQQGKILLLSDRSVDERARWTEPYAVRTLPRMENADAAQLLDHLLRAKNLQGEIPPAKYPDVVDWLGGNPRALQVLVASLAYDSLDSLIGDNPDTWALQDRRVSAELLHSLEENLLQRVLAHLPQEALLFMRRLAVYRKPLQVEALKSASANESEMFRWRDELIGRFLLERNHKYYSFNPVARQIAVYQLKQDANIARAAHSLAAEHYLRHFKAKQILDSGGRLGGYFVEARYHLSHAGRSEEISQWANLFANHLRTTLDAKIPSDPAERDTKIALLSGLLEHGGARGLEFFLARLLKARRQPGDLEKAIKHLRRAVSSAHVDSWRLLIELEQEVNGFDAAIRAAKEGIKKIPPENGAFALYVSCGDLLARQNKLDDAIALLKDGITKIPIGSAFALYQSCGELLARQNKLDDAITLLKDGIAKIPAANDVRSLYQSCGELLARQDKLNDAIDLLKDGIAKIPPDRNVFALYQSCGELLARQDKLDDAIALLRQGVRAIPENQGRYKVVESLLWLCTANGNPALLQDVLNAGGADEIGQQQKALGKIKLAYLQNDWAGAAQTARAARQQFPTYTPLIGEDIFASLAADDTPSAAQALPQESREDGAEHPLLWLRAWVALLSGDNAQAQTALAAYLGHESGEAVSRQVLLRLWDTSGSTLRYVFPLLPPALTGLPQAVRSLQYGPAVLAEALITQVMPEKVETAENGVLPTAQTAASSRLQFLTTLNNLLPAQFDQVVFACEIPTQYLTPGAQAQRAIEVIRYLEGRRALMLLQQAIAEIAKPSA